MHPLASIPDALTAIDHFLILHARELDQGAVNALLISSAKASPVDKIVEIGELLYSIRDGLMPDGLGLASLLIDFATRNSYHGLQLDGRGTGMVAALRRQMGHDHPAGGEWPGAEADPAAKPIAGLEPPAMPLGSAPELMAAAPAVLEPPA